ncbi:MAG: hypothetical protein Q4F17_02410 [Eubacteriales bacterium]|nr:hypothetical protein [Eubacteriales bacterium]
MKLETRKVKLSSAEIKNIYLEAFPKKERMPFPMMVAMSKLWNTRFFSFYDSETPCGLIYLASNRNLVFVMFLAVDKSLQSNGYGSSILQQIKNMYPDKKIIISIEPCNDNAPDIALRKRRKSFYMQNEYKETGYMMKLNGVVQEILITNGAFSKREFQSFFLFYSFGSIYPKIWK